MTTPIPDDQNDMRLPPESRAPAFPSLFQIDDGTEITDPDTLQTYLLRKSAQMINWTTRGVSFSLHDTGTSRVKLNVSGPGGYEMTVGWAPGWSSTTNVEFHRMPDPIKDQVRAAVEAVKAYVRRDSEHRALAARQQREDAARHAAEAADAIAKQLSGGDRP